MIRLRRDGENASISALSARDVHERCALLQQRLDAVRDYVEVCAADELEPTVILDLLDPPRG